MFGSHLSIAGGMHKALLEAERLTFDTVQVFTKNQQQWKAAPLDPAVVAEFEREAQRIKFTQIVAHDSYLINLASGDAALRQKSIEAFANELKRCDALGIAYLVSHPGAHVGQGESVGLDKVIAGLNEILDADPSGRATVCVETTAGQGSCLGCSFEHIAAILRGVNRKERVGVCVDTAHILAAGYDITTEDGTRRVIEEFDRVVGMQHLKVFHLNDSKKPLGSRVDRHTHIGHGFVGLPAFGVIARDPRFAAIPKILETPKEKATNGKDWDEINVDILRKLAAGKKVRVDRTLVSEV